MKLRVFPLLFLLTLLLCVSVQAQNAPSVLSAELTAESASPAAASPADDSPFSRTRAYESAFDDVPEASWYAGAVASAYEYGLMEGRGERSFAPEDSITVAELLTLSARLRSTYEHGDAAVDFARGADTANWFDPYLSYLSERGLLTITLAHYDTPATRAQMASIFAASLPEEWYDDRNAQLVTDAYISRDFITDVDDYTPYQTQILWMYKQGLLIGMDASGSFAPYHSVTRAEIATLLTRLVEPDTRLTPDWTVLPYHSAVGTSFAGLAEAPAQVDSAPSFENADAIDALVRQMIVSGQNTVTLSYPRTLTGADATALARAFTQCVKTYCEQMYNSVSCKAYSSGRAYLTFSSTACSDAQLRLYRERTMERAAAIHDMLWESGALSYEMSEYEIARTYFIWLCENCRYDNDALAETSLSHTAYSALVNGVAVCDGYTGAYNLLLKLEGIDCYALFNASHIWTVAYLDGIEYHIDTTWGDQFGRVDMSCFGMTAEQSRAKHAW